jgi:hypothetical protein
LDAWRRQLLEENEQLAKAHHFDTLRKEAEREPIPPGNSGVGLAFAPENGALAHWLIHENTRPSDLNLQIIPVPSVPALSPLVQCLLVVLVAGFMLSFVPAGVGLVRGLWPEELCAVVVLGMVTLGISLLACVLLALAVSFRIIWLVRNLRKWLQRRATTATPAATTQ